MVRLCYETGLMLEIVNRSQRAKVSTEDVCMLLSFYCTFVLHLFLCTFKLFGSVKIKRDGHKIDQACPLSI